MSSFLAPSAFSGQDLAELEGKLASSLQSRMNSHASFNSEEVMLVEQRPFRLLPIGYKLNAQEEAYLRALACRYRITIRPPFAISSHRRFIGPIIVLGKRLMWRLLNFFLAGPLEQLEDFHRILIKGQAEQLARIFALEVENQKLHDGAAQTGADVRRPS